MEIVYHSLKDRLKHLMAQCEQRPVAVRVIVDTLEGRGQAVLLVLLALPFCQPIQIPGFSTPFGIVLIFIGLRIAFGHRTWIPQTLLNHEISYETLEKIAWLAINITDKLSFLTSARWTYLVNNPILRTAHGVSIALMASFLALPLPIPFTNLLTAYPIFFFGLALLEDDGLMIFIAYLLFYICLGVFALLLFFGKEFFASIVA